MSKLRYDTAKYRSDLAAKLGNTKAAARLRISEFTIYRARKIVAQVEKPAESGLSFEQWHFQFSECQMEQLLAKRREVRALEGLYNYKMLKAAG